LKKIKFNNFKEILLNIVKSNIKWKVVVYGV
jgi:hypothetical protein